MQPSCHTISTGNGYPFRRTTSAKAVSSNHKATNRKVGEDEETPYHSVVCWESSAETTSTYVEGRLPDRTFTDQEGHEHGIVKIVANDVQFLSRRSETARDTSITDSSAMHPCDKEHHSISRGFTQRSPILDLTSSSLCVRARKYRFFV
jgi:single-stranded DNA-binding protein